MNVSRLWSTVALALGIGLFAGCKTGPKFDARSTPGLAFTSVVAVTNQVSPDLLKPDGEYFTLGPGDSFEAEIVGDATSRTVLTIGPDGRVYFNILPGEEVWGLTLAEAKTKLETALRKFISDATVNVSLRTADSKSVWLLGQFIKPGIYPINGPTTLLEAIGMAGGTAPVAPTLTAPKAADLNRSFVMRQGKLLPVNFRALLLEGDVRQNIYLKPDDFVFIPSAQLEQVYVLGGVRVPHPQTYQENMTLVSAISAAQGTVSDAYESHVAIVRGSLAQPKVAVVNYRAIVRGEAPDVPLEPQDIVYVPLTPWQDLTRLVRQLTGTFVSTVAANEGARWVNPASVPVGISINPGGVGGGGSTGGAAAGGGGGQ